MAMILDAFVRISITKLTKIIEGEMSMMLGVEDELRRLQRRMERISGFLESAEREGLSKRDIRIWVRDFKDVMYDADDIIGLCEIEGRKLLEGHPSMVRHPSSLFSCFSCIKFRHEIGSKIRKLNNRLKQIAEDESILPKLEYSMQDVHESRINHRQTFPNEVKSDFVGTQIEEATQKIVKLLIEGNNKRYRVLVIDGMGGIGKTTLASNIYSDQRIKENFPIRAWVCVSKDFSEIKLLNDMIKQIDKNYNGGESKAVLIPYLSSIFVKRFFIVLDDMWSSDVWKDLFRFPLESATASGRIVITTRIRNVAIEIRADIHHVSKMDNNTGWALLCKKVFGDDDVEEEEINNLREVGIEIVKKCDGLPLAIKTIAGVLISKERSSLAWDKVLKSDAWSMSQLQEELPGALFLSYQDLPSDLKQCFLYCSLYPEDSLMDQMDLIRYWMAEGFVKGTQGDTLMEDLAEEYYTELIRRNLLQLVVATDVTCCSMHDVLRSLAIFLIGDESTLCSNDQSPNINPLVKLRRLSMENMKERLPNVIKQQTCLRTLMLLDSPGIKMIENELIENLRFLRSITINDTGLESVPDSLGNLLHLRHLDLCCTIIRELPESIGCLVNLQTLNLSGCRFLHKLPKTITKLCNLRCLQLEEETPPTHVPKGIGKLKHLNHLEGFVVGHEDTGATDEEGCDLDELRSLSQLRFLQINRLEMAQAEGASALANCHFLRTLILYCKTGVIRNIQDEAIQRINETYEGLSPPSTLQKLEIRCFFGTGFPRWMMSPSLDASFPNLTKIVLSVSTSCPQLPPLGLLRQLKFLNIGGADAITTIEPEFLGPRASSAPTAFPKLEVLYFSSMQNWEEWSFGEGVSEERKEGPKLLPCLRSLHLYYCPKLRALPENLRHATSLQKLDISKADKLIEINDLPSLTEELSISENPMLERVSNLPSLKYLKIRDCPRLQHVENLDKLQCLTLYLLEKSTTNDDGRTPRLPEWLLGLLGQHQNAQASFQNLRKFHLECSIPLLKTFLKDGPNWPIIEWIPEVMIKNYVSNQRPYVGFTNASLSYIRYTKAPPTFETHIEE